MSIILVWKLWLFERSNDEISVIARMVKVDARRARIIYWRRPFRDAPILPSPEKYNAEGMGLRLIKIISDDEAIRSHRCFKDST